MSAPQPLQALQIPPTNDSHMSFRDDRTHGTKMPLARLTVARPRRYAPKGRGIKGGTE
jgi:hypothetical protein